MTVPPNTSKARRFRFWIICILLFVIGSGYTLYVTRPSEPSISVSFVRTNVFGTPFRSSVIQVSNRMSFTVNCWFKPELERSGGEWVGAETPEVYYHIGSLAAHAQNVVAIHLPDGARLSVSYERPLKPLELSVFRSFPQLKVLYPFHRRRSFPVYEILSDVHGSSHSTYQPSKQ
jgi:hypothetical protein